MKVLALPPSSRGSYWPFLHSIKMSLLALFVGFAISPDSFAQTDANAIGKIAEYRGVLLAQSEDEDVYDPFADFSEFDEASEEEADINFFKHGRFATIGLMLGYRTFTDGMRKVFKDTLPYGVYLSYFFDLRFALQLSFMSGTHDISFKSGSSGTPVRGSSTVTVLGINLKYYFNTQNVTRGLADFNPYIIGGFSNVSRTSTVSGVEAFSKDSSMSFDIGTGIEIPISRNKMFVGGQIMYQMVNFKDENSEIIIDGTDRTGIYPAGDYLTLLGIFGVNF